MARSVLLLDCWTSASSLVLGGFCQTVEFDKTLAFYGHVCRWDIACKVRTWYAKFFGMALVSAVFATLRIFSFMDRKAQRIPTTFSYVSTLVTSCQSPKFGLLAVISRLTTLLSVGEKKLFLTHRFAPQTPVSPAQHAWPGSESKS